MKPTRHIDIETRLLPDGHVVLFSQKSDWAHTITPLGAIVWEFCDGENSIEEIEAQVRKVSKNTDTKLGDQIRSLITEFEESGLLNVENEQ